MQFFRQCAWQVLVVVFVILNFIFVDAGQARESLYWPMYLPAFTGKHSSQGSGPLVIKDSTWPKYFFVSGTKAYTLFKQEGIDAHSYSYGHRVYKSWVPSEVTAWKEAQRRSRNEDDFIIVINYGVWMGGRKSYVTDLQNVGLMDNYLGGIKQTFQLLATAKGRVLVNFPPDPLAYFAGDIRKNYNNDARNVPSRINETRIVRDEGFGEIPANFAGFWQVIDRLRCRYAPNVMLAYTLKTWGIGVDPGHPPHGDAWQKSDQEIRNKVAYLQSYGVDWDALAFNYNPGAVHHDKAMARRIATYYAAIAKGLGVSRRTGSQVRPFIWKTKICPEQYLNDDPNQWRYGADLYFEMTNIRYLASLGYAGINLGYGNELIGSGKSWPSQWKGRPLILPPILKCWLKEYFSGQPGNCPVEATIGRVPLQ